MLEGALVILLVTPVRISQEHYPYAP